MSQNAQRVILIGVMAVLLAYPGVARCDEKGDGDDTHPAIIAHPAVPEETLTDHEVRNAFLGKKTKWSNGEPLVLVTIKDEPVHEAFLRRFINKTPTRFRLYWKSLAFTGKAPTPIALPDEQAVIDYVTNTKGAVGYISLGKAKAAGCKILANHGP